MACWGPVEPRFWVGLFRPCKARWIRGNRGLSELERSDREPPKRGGTEGTDKDNHSRRSAVGDFHSFRCWLRRILTKLPNAFSRPLLLEDAAVSVLYQLAHLLTRIDNVMR